MSQAMIDAVKKLSDKDKVRFLQRANQLGLKYHPGTGKVTIDDPGRFVECWLGKSKEPNSVQKD